MLHLSYIVKTLIMSSQALNISHWCIKNKELTINWWETAAKPLMLQLHLNIMLKE